MITLCIDIGNTRTKVAAFDGLQLLDEQTTTEATLRDFIKKYNVEHAIISTVSQQVNEIASVLSTNNIPMLQLTYNTPLPFKVNYNTPETLGMDRVAGMAAAHFLYPSINCLVIDAGTCITYDFISADAVYSGGAISPGLLMRLKAMYHFTGKLPEVSLANINNFEGKSTVESLLSGVVFSAIDEINGRIARYTERYGSVQTILCGGDSPMLAEQLKNNIFAAPSLVMTGLNQILLFNVNKG